MKPRPSNRPTSVGENTWFYETRGRIDVVHWCVKDGKKTHAAVISIPWKKIMEAAARCRPEQVKPRPVS